MEKRSPDIVMEKGSPKTIMDRLPPKSPVTYERIKSGCAWGLMSFLDFRQGPSDKKLISDRNRHAAGDEYASKRRKLLSNFDKKSIEDVVYKKRMVVGTGLTEAKKTMEEKLTTDQHIKKITTAKVVRAQSDSGPVGCKPKNRRKASKTFWRPCYSNDVVAVGHRQPSHHDLAEKSLDKLESTMTEEIFDHERDKPGTDYCSKSIGSVKNEQVNEINLQAKMHVAAEAFANQKFIHGKDLGRDGASHQSKILSDALEILNSNKELFVKLIQDPNSLLVKHVQDLQDSQAKKQLTKSILRAQSLDYQNSSAMEFEEHVCTKNFTSIDRYPANGSGDTSAIVILKPGQNITQDVADDSEKLHSLQLPYDFRKKGQRVKAAKFSFQHVKGKLRHAMGGSRKEQLCTSSNHKLLQSPYDCQSLGGVGKGTWRQIVGRNSPSETYFDKMGRTKDFERKVTSTSENGQKFSNLSFVRHLEESKSNIYDEYRKKLFEMLSYGNEEFLSKRIPKSPRRITSLPEYNFLPTRAFGWDKELGAVKARTRFSPNSSYQMTKENKRRIQSIFHQQMLDVEAPSWADTKKPNEQLETYNTEANVSEDLVPDTQVHSSICLFGDDSHTGDSVKILKINDKVNLGETSTLKVPSSSDGTNNGSANPSTDTPSMCEESGVSECPKLDSPFGNDASVPSIGVCSSSPSSSQMGGSDGFKGRAGQVSSVSVVEQFITVDVVSSACTLSQAEHPDQTIRSNVEEHHLDSLVRSPQDLKMNLITSFDDNESTTNYVREVLQASGSDWDELSMKCCHSSGLQLNPSVYDDQGQMWPNQSFKDCRLFSDYINDVFLGVYQSYFGCSPWVSVIDQKVQRVPMANDLLNEVIRCVDWGLITQPPSRTMQQLVEKDLEKAGTWLDIRIDLEDIVKEIVEISLEELIMDTSLELQI
ncbi:DUF3741 domain-containing protein/DUF4378 domain-containing protein [Cephalotus follicularis]|uniref:DUF3741 domain-containing protein/DUF4378 domain-containing protein n=1 Tax=Cephalotus follicularis TaxID=3775 RepID=A0A1Q3CUH5_CEPFO|nr:DUF3741 domain-containing protein/DUF4378 domain-containing protein [Cephalotus follicularis]